MRADAVVVGCDVGHGVVFAGREGGGEGESAGAQCKEDEWLEVHCEVGVEVDVSRML